MVITLEDYLMKFDFPDTKTVLPFFWGTSYKFKHENNANDIESICYTSTLEDANIYVIVPDDLLVGYESE